MTSGLMINTGQPNPNGRAVSLYDRGIFPTAGDLVLFDAAHSLQGLGLTTIPTNGQTIKNLARLKAAKVLSLTSSEADMATTDLSFVRGVGTHSSLARTAKGGLDFNIGTSGSASTDNAYLSAPVAVRNFISANTANLLDPAKDHLAISIWQRPRRAAISTQPGIAGVFTTGNAYANVILTGGSSSPTTGTLEGSLNAIGYAQTLDTPVMRAIASTSWSATSPAVPTGANMSVVCGLLPPPYNASSWWNNSGVWTLYRWRVIDLTKSGITYATFEAVEYALFLDAFSAPGTVITLSATAAAFFGVSTFTATGRYYGDSGFPAILA